MVPKRLLDDIALFQAGGAQMLIQKIACRLRDNGRDLLAHSTKNHFPTERIPHGLSVALFSPGPGSGGKFPPRSSAASSSSTVA